jgi:Tol biopolymer transport system component
VKRSVLLLGLALALLVPAAGSGAPSGKETLDCSCYEYFRVRADGTHYVQVAPVLGDLEDVSPDGTRALFQHEFGVLYVSRITGAPAPVRVAATRPGYINGRLSPDGTQVAYLLYPQAGPGPGIASIHVVGADGLDDRVVVPTGAWSLAWSPGGRALAYVRVAKPQAGPSQLVTVDLTTGAERVVASRAGLVRDVAWSPSGDRLAYVTDRLHVVRADGTRDLAISRGDSPTWSPDGRRLAYRWYGPGRLKVRLAVIAPDGSLNHVVDPRDQHQWFQAAFAWSPDSRKLVYWPVDD